MGTHAMEADERILEPDVLLPAQIFTERTSAHDPTRRLMAALLVDAVRCFQTRLFSTGERDRILFTDAVDWFESRDPAPFFSFESVCAVLGLDADYIRSGLRRWRETKERETGAARGPSRHPAARDDEDQDGDPSRELPSSEQPGVRRSAA